MSQDNAHALVTLHVLALHPDGALPAPLKALFRELSTVDLDRSTGLDLSPLVPVFVTHHGASYGRRLVWRPESAGPTCRRGRSPSGCGCAVSPTPARRMTAWLSRRYDRDGSEATNRGWAGERD